MNPDVDRFRCSPAARWLPRALAGAVLAGAMIASAAPPGSDPAASRLLRPIVVVVGAILAWWVLRKGSVLRREVHVGETGMTISLGRHARTLEYRDVASVDAHVPFEGRMQWVPTVSLVDVFDKSWDVPTVLRAGPLWLERVLDRCAREDLATWADARDLRRRMERSGWFVVGGYLVAAGIVIGSVLVHLR